MLDLPQNSALIQRQRLILLTIQILPKSRPMHRLSQLINVFQYFYWKTSILFGKNWYFSNSYEYGQYSCHCWSWFSCKINRQTREKHVWIIIRFGQISRDLQLLPMTNVMIQPCEKALINIWIKMPILALCGSNAILERNIILVLLERPIILLNAIIIPLDSMDVSSSLQKSCRNFKWQAHIQNAFMTRI